MNVLITHQFNHSMQNIPEKLRNEAVELFRFASKSSKNEIIDAPFVTNIVSKSDDIFTITGPSVRVFCSFPSPDSDDIFFLDVKAKDKQETNLSKQNENISLFDKNGEPIAYIFKEKDIYLFNGKPVAYIDKKKNVYGFNGNHLGWFEDDILWDHKGARAGFTKSSYPGIVKYEPLKGFKQFKPFRSYAEYAPFKPYKLTVYSSVSLKDLLLKGSK